MDLKLGASYFGIRDPRHVRKDLEEMKEKGCNAVLHTFSENDYQFYRETMKEIVDLSKDEGMETYIDPWGVGGVFGGEAFSKFLVDNTEARQILSDGRPAPSACPNNKDFRKFLRNWIDAAVETGSDYIFWDEPHFFLPEWHGIDAWGCRCKTCRKLFEERHGYPMPKKINKDIREFKEDCLYEFLEDMTKTAKKKGGKNALCLLPDWQNKEKVKDNWKRYAKLDSLDIFGSDPYWILADQSRSDFEFYTKKTLELSDNHGKEAQIWVQAFKIDKEDEKKPAEDVLKAHDIGIKNIMAWSFRGTSYMSSISCKNPEKVWSEITSAYKKIR